MNPELYISQLSLAESCKFFENQPSDSNSNRRFSATSFRKIPLVNNTKIIINENEGEEDDLEDTNDNNATKKLNSNETEADLKEKPNAPHRKGWRKYIGLILTIVHVITFTLSALLVKFLDGYHPLALSFWRFQGVFLPSAVVLAYHSIDCLHKNESSTPVLKNILPPFKDGNWKRILMVFVSL